MKKIFKFLLGFCVAGFFVLWFTLGYVFFLFAGGSDLWESPKLFTHLGFGIFWGIIFALLFAWYKRREDKPTWLRGAIIPVEIGIAIGAILFIYSILVRWYG